MKSRISIALDFNNNPIIKIEYRQSDDVRDDIIKRFLEGFAAQSSWCKMNFDSNRDYAESHNLGASVSWIKPIYPLEMKGEAQIMLEQHRVSFPKSK